MRARFWIETALAVAAVALFLLTLVSREWIELVFGVDPDHGNGSLEWLIAIALLCTSGAFSYLARREWRAIVDSST
jgi:hypothetical protein